MYGLDFLFIWLVCKFNNKLIISDYTEDPGLDKPQRFRRAADKWRVLSAEEKAAIKVA
jgi:hypothetical protein